MSDTAICVWIEKLKDAWVNRDPKATVQLFSNNVKYYESVLEEPFESKEEVYELWKVVPSNQDNVSFEYKIISVPEGIVNWKVKRTLLPSNKCQIIDGIFQIKLDSNGLCCFFKQWRTSKEI